MSPTGKPGGLAMHGRVRNWSYLAKGKPNLTRKAQPDPDFTPDERQVIAQAAGTVVDLDETRPASGLSGAACATHPSDGPGPPAGARTRLYARCHRPHPGGGLIGFILVLVVHKDGAVKTPLACSNTNEPMNGHT